MRFCLFSYIIISAGTKTDYTNDDYGFIDDLSHLEFSDSDTLSEQILRKIDLLQSQARKLKTRVDKTVNKSPQKFSSINMLSSPALTGSRNQPSPTRSGDRALVRSQPTSSQHRSECHFRVLFRPESAVSSHGEVTPIPDMIQGSCQHLAGISYENVSSLFTHSSSSWSLESFFFHHFLLLTILLLF